MFLTKDIIEYVKFDLKPISTKLHNSECDNIVTILDENDKIVGKLIRNAIKVDDLTDVETLIKTLNVNTDDIIDTKPFPIAYSNHSYTGETNLDLNKITSLVNSLLVENGFNQTVNSCYCHTYSKNTPMSMHKDKCFTTGNSIGVSVSTRGNCDFLFENLRFYINRGDVFIGDFSKYKHGIRRVYKHLKTDPLFRDRLNLQFRNVDADRELISNDEFLKILNN